MAINISLSYQWIDKDPIIDVFRDAQRRSGMTYQEIHAEGGPTPETTRRWDKGKTKRPQHLTFRFAMQAMGFTEQWVNKEGEILQARYTRDAVSAGRVVSFRRAS